MKKETYLVYLKESLGFLSGRTVEIKCDGMTTYHPDKLAFYVSIDSENPENNQKIIAEFNLSKIIGWRKR